MGKASLTSNLCADMKDKIAVNKQRCNSNKYRSSMAGEMTASQECKEGLCCWKEMDLEKKTGLRPKQDPGA